MSGKCRRTAGSHTSAGCLRLCPTAQHPSSTSLGHTSCCWCRGDKDAGHPYQTCRGSPGGAEYTMGTLDQQSPLMAHEHIRDPQQTYPPSSKLQSWQLLKAAYCISDSISHRNHLFYWREDFYRNLMVLQGLIFTAMFCKSYGDWAVSMVGPCHWKHCGFRFANARHQKSHC